MLRFLPWKFIVRRAARAYGFADPALWLARIRKFAQPSEVAEPIELVRAGVLFHARGIVNARAIQHNLDWVWPYWAERQFDPEDISFIPRAFSLSHINLTHRNWTAVGLPDLAVYPLVDPRGLVTPLHDGWSIDCWLLDAAGNALVPSRTHDEAVTQQLTTDERLAVVTSCHEGGLALEQTTHVEVQAGEPVLHIDVKAHCAGGGALVVALRPYNPEGVQFIDDVQVRKDASGWVVNSQTEVVLDRAPDAMLASNYEQGDVFAIVVASLGDAKGTTDEHNGAAVQPNGASLGETHLQETHCPVGMATAAAVYRFGESRTEVSIRVPLTGELAAMASPKRFDPFVTWASVRDEMAELRVPDERLQFLYDSAVRTLTLLSADDVVPGPYTYRRFWFRDACLMMNALLTIGMADRCRRGIERFPERQLHNGYFRSQEGEWDSNGQVLWLVDRYETLSGKPLDPLRESLAAAVRWIDAKRTVAKGSRHEGLLPAGFSAEHLGPNDHYYWDDFWAEAGLRAAERIFTRAGRADDAGLARRLADEMHAAIERSIERIPAGQGLGGIPASPYRRMDAGAIGSLVADYPLQLYPAGEARIMATVEAIVARYFHQGGFFQDIIHSGINAYLTLDVAQTLLRAGDARYRKLIETVARLATSTGQWPEAIHPQTLGGCMGDGQHGWAAAEWVMMIRNCFAREEGDRLVVGSGLFREWFESDGEILFGPTLTPWGAVTVRVRTPSSTPEVVVEGQWRGMAPKIEVAVPGYERVVEVDGSGVVHLAASLATRSAAPTRVASERG